MKRKTKRLLSLMAFAPLATIVPTVAYSCNSDNESNNVNNNSGVNNDVNNGIDNNTGDNINKPTEPESSVVSVEIFGDKEYQTKEVITINSKVSYYSGIDPSNLVYEWYTKDEGEVEWRKETNNENYLSLYVNNPTENLQIKLVVWVKGEKQTKISNILSIKVNATDTSIGNDIDKINEELKSVTSNLSNNTNKMVLDGETETWTLSNIDNIISKYSEKISLKWFNGTNEISSNVNKNSLTLSSTGEYTAKVVYKDSGNKELVLKVFGPINYTVFSDFNSLRISKNYDNLSDEITSIDLHLVNLPGVSNRTFKVQWSKDGTVIRENDLGITITEAGTYTVKIISSSNQTVFEKSETINKIQPPPSVDPNLVDWSKTRIETSAYQFAYDSKEIKLKLVNVPDVIFQNQNRFNVELYRNQNGDDSKVINSNFTFDSSSKTIYTTINYNSTNWGNYSINVKDNVSTYDYSSSEIQITIGQLISPFNHGLTVNQIDKNDSNGLKYKEVSLNLSSLTISENDFNNFYDVKWSKDNVINHNWDNQHKILVGESGNYQCLIIRKSNSSNSNNIKINFTVTNQAIDINASLGNQKTIINSSTNIYNSIDLTIGNYSQIKEKNLRIKFDGNELIESTNSPEKISESTPDNNSKTFTIENAFNVQKPIVEVLNSENVVIASQDLSSNFESIEWVLDINENNLKSLVKTTEESKNIIDDSVINPSSLNAKYEKLSINHKELTEIKTTSVGIFSNMKNLKSIVIDAPKLSKIESSAFENCSSLSSVDLSKTIVDSISNKLFYNDSKLSDVKLPNTIKSIGDQSFYNTGSISSMKIDGDLSYIGNSAFENSKIVKIDVSKSKNLKLNSNSFKNASKLTDFIYYGLSENENIPLNSDVSVPNDQTKDMGLYEIGSSSFEGCLTLKNFININSLDENITSQQIKEKTGLYLSDSIKELGVNAFKRCRNLIDIKHLSKNITTIKSGTFSETGLKEIKLPSTVTTIETNAFADSSIKKIEINEGVTYLGDSAFAGNFSLTEATLPKTLQTIGNSIFEGTQLATLNINFNNIKLTGSYSAVFSGVESIETINFGKDVINWIDDENTVSGSEKINNENTNNKKVSLKTLFSSLQNKENIKVTCYSNELKQKLVDAGFSENNITILVSDLLPSTPIPTPDGSNNSVGNTDISNGNSNELENNSNDIGNITRKTQVRFK